eukprot:6198528-Pleurochrysis_carterae.AAC.1
MYYDIIHHCTLHSRCQAYGGLVSCEAAGTSRHSSIFLSNCRRILQLLEDWLHANQGPREKQTGSFTAECALICLPKHPFAGMPLTARDAGQTGFICPESVPARAATSRS